MRIPGVPYVQGRNDYDDQDGLHYGFAIHNTANDADDEDEANYAKHRPDGVSSHFYVDDNSVTQSLDTVDRAGHAGSSNGNNNAIAFEFTGTNSKSRAWWLANIAWDRVGYVIAYIIQHDPDYKGFQVRRASVAEMRSNPKVKAFYGHDDMRRAWGGTTHTDPGPNFPWDRLFAAVNTALEGDDVEAKDVFEYPVANQVTGKPTKFRIFVTAWNNSLSRLETEAKAQRLRDEAVLAAVKGDASTAQILARIDQRAAEDAARDAELAELVRQGQSGELDAAEVVRRMGELLSAPAPQD